jgi:hypothetical protein
MGCSVLAHAPKDPCTGADGCAGAYACNGKKAVACVAPALNACMGCAVLAHAPGDPCVLDDGCPGAFACSGTALVCESPLGALCDGGIVDAP